MPDNDSTGATFATNTFSDRMRYSIHQSIIISTDNIPETLLEDIQSHAQVGVIGQCLSPGQEESRSNHVTRVHDRNEPVIKDVLVKAAS